MDVSIVTLSRTQEYVERLSDALGHQQLGLLEVERLLVNNASDPKLTAAALRGGWAVIEPGHNTSYSEGHNLARKAAQGEYLLLLNDDVIPEPEFLARLWFHCRKTDVGVLGALLLHGNGTVNHAGSWVSHVNCTTNHIGRFDPREKWERDQAEPRAAVTFAAVLIKRSLWDQLGGLDERFYYGFEDTDFCLRVLQAGGTVRVALDAVAVHDECGTRPRGGAEDHHNYHGVFRPTWHGDRLKSVLTSYVQRMLPERVEGL